MRFFVVAHYDFTIFKSEVEAMLRNGWMFHGVVFTKDNGRTLCQAFIKKD